MQCFYTIYITERSSAALKDVVTTCSALSAALLRSHTVLHYLHQSPSSRLTMSCRGAHCIYSSSSILDATSINQACVPYHSIHRLPIMVAEQRALIRSIDPP